MHKDPPIFTVAPRANPVPVMLIVVPPESAPALGEMLVTESGKEALKLVKILEIKEINGSAKQLASVIINEIFCVA